MGVVLADQSLLHAMIENIWAPATPPQGSEMLAHAVNVILSQHCWNCLHTLQSALVFALSEADARYQSLIRVNVSDLRRCNRKVFGRLLADFEWCGDVSLITGATRSIKFASQAFVQLSNGMQGRPKYASSRLQIL